MTTVLVYGLLGAGLVALALLATERGREFADALPRWLNVIMLCGFAVVTLAIMAMALWFGPVFLE